MQSLRQICLGILGLFAGAILQAQDFSFKEVEVSHEAPITIFQHPWQGMRVALLGDSISDPMMTRYMGRKQYWSYLEDWLQLQVYDYAVSGMEWNDVPRQLGKLEEEHGADVDVIKEAGNVWSVNVIDLNAVSNMHPLHGQDFYYGGGNDLLHPGEEGSRHLASVLYYQLLTIAVKDL